MAPRCAAAVKIRSTAAVRLKKCRFVGHAAAVTTPGEVEEVVALLQKQERVVPHAYRLEAGRLEGCDDAGDVGVGEKLLHVLQQWDVEDVVVAVARDDSAAIIEGGYLGVRRYKIATDCAKSVLRLCYLEDAAAAGDDDAATHASQKSAERESPAAAAAAAEEKVAKKDTKKKRGLGPNAKRTPNEPERGPELRPPRHDIGTNLPPVGRDLDSCGSVRVAPRGRVNNFEYGRRLGPAVARPSPETSLTVRAEEHLRATSQRGAPPPKSFETAQTDLELFSATARAEFRSVRIPHGEVEAAARAACALLWGLAWFDSRAYDWIDVRSALTEPAVSDALAVYVPDPTEPTAVAVADRLLKAGLGPDAADRVRMHSTLAGDLVDWLWLKLYVFLEATDPAAEASALRALALAEIAQEANQADDLLVPLSGDKLVVPARPEDVERIGNRVQAKPTASYCTFGTQNTWGTTTAPGGASPAGGGGGAGDTRHHRGGTPHDDAAPPPLL